MRSRLLRAVGLSTAALAAVTLAPHTPAVQTPTAQATSGSCASSITRVFLSMGHSSNGAWGHNAAGALVASERNYNTNGTIRDGIVNPQIVGNPNNLPCDLLNFTADGGAPHWFGGRHTLGVGDDYISGTEALTVTLGAGLAGRTATSAVANLSGTAPAATVQPLLNGVPVGPPQTVTLGNARPISATGGAAFNGLRFSAATGTVAITGTPGRPREAVQFNLAPSCGTGVARVFLSMGHSSNGAWGHNSAGALVASELNYDANGRNLDGIVNPQIVGSPNNLPCDLLNFTAVGGLPHWFGGRHTLGVGDDYISGTEALTVTLGAGLAGRTATSAVANLSGTAPAATVQPLLNGVPVGSPQTVTLGNARPISATGGAAFNGLRFSATTGTVAITGTPGNPREAVQFVLN